MMMGHLLCAMIIAIAFASFWLITGGSLATAFAVYTMSGVLSMATFASMTALAMRNSTG